jgi:galactokinase
MIFRAPGRVNLIGEHTDYNDGFVMPAAIGLYTCAAVLPSGDSRLKVYSANFDETREFDLTSLPAGRTGHWSDYVVGVAAVLKSQGCTLCGANLVISSEVPIGAGLSSSAAMEVATALALLAAAGLDLDRATTARVCQRAENEFTGARCGIMDQFVACFGEAGSALLLDCRSLDYSLLPIGDQVRIVICDTQVKHSVAGGEYNRRRADCESSVEYLKRYIPGVTALRDVSMPQLEKFGSGLSATALKRCRHVISENARVLAAAEALKKNDYQRFGRLMVESHLSLRDDYQVSCAELDLLVNNARNIEGVLGARMTGGGFGGCTVNLVETRAVERFKRDIARTYSASTSVVPGIYVCSAVAGAGPVRRSEHP